MINANIYAELVESYFSFLEKEFGYILIQEKIRENVFYEIRYAKPNKQISVSYENLEDYFLVTIFLLENGKLPDYDDKSKTLHLSQLNKTILPIITSQQIQLNNNYFSIFKTSDRIENRILKSAKELRLCMNFI